MNSAELENCRICGSGEIDFDKKLPSERKNETCTFYICKQCGTIMDSANLVPDYSSNEDAASFNSEYNIKFYAESGAGLFFIALQLELLQLILFSSQLNQTGLKYLDVGAGFGFSLHMAKYLGWDVLGIEPSSMGRTGSEKLGVNIISNTLEDANIPESHFDIIASSEVIEHVQNPDVFIQNLSLYLAPQGILLLTTPNADVAIPGSSVEKEWLESYGPGFHYNIFSPRSLQMLLARNGFVESTFLLSEGSSDRKRIIIAATKHKGILPKHVELAELKERTKNFIIQYLENLIGLKENSQQEDEIYRGALYRLYEILINDAKFEQSRKYLDKLEYVNEPMGLDIESIFNLQADSLEDYLQKSPSYLGQFYFLKGIYHLNYTKEYSEASKLFKIACYLCEIEKKVGLYCADPNRYERIKFHYGLALLYDNKQSAAIPVFADLLEREENLPVDTLETLQWSKGIAHLQIRENNKAVISFTNLLFKRYAEVYKPELHLILSFNQSIEDLDGKISSIDSRLDQLTAEINSKFNQVTEMYSRDKSLLMEKLLVYEAILYRGIGKLSQISGKIKFLVKPALFLLEAPGRLSRKFFKPKDFVISEDGSEVTVGELLYDKLIEQQIQCSANSFSSISLKIGTFARVNTSHLYIEILDEDKNRISYTSKNASLFNDNRLHTFSFEPIPDSLGKKFWLRISSNASRGNAVTLWCSRRNALSDRLLINGEKSRISLIYELGYVGSTVSTTIGIKDILIITPDKLGKIRIGLGMRHWEISKALANKGFKVTLASPHPMLDPELQDVGFELHAPLSQEEALHIAQQHKFVMVQGDILLRYPSLEASQQQIIVDMVTPFHIEDIEKGQKEFEHGYSVIRKCLIRGDYFVCGNESQRIYWLGMLTALGRISRETRDQNPAFYSLIDVVGFGIPDEAPVKSQSVIKGAFSNIKQADFVIMWMGGIWDWLDPLTLIEAVHKAHQQDERIKLFFPAYRQSNGEPSLMAQKSKDLAIRLSALDKSIFFNEYPVPYEERGNYLLESDVGVVCQAKNFETQVSARTRVLDYIWAGLPILINEGDEWCELVRRYNIGVVVSGNSINAWKDAILELVCDTEARQIKIANIEKIKLQYYWNRTVEPLVKYITNKNAQTRNYESKSGSLHNVLQ